MPGASDKVCAYCQQDCSDKPRAKDAQGRYYCKDCFPLAQAAQKKGGGAPARTGGGGAGGGGGGGAGAGAVAPMGGSVFDDPILLTPDLAPPKEEVRRAGMAAPVVKEAPPINCPSCGIQMKAGSVICTNCGFNLETKKGAKTKIQKAEVFKEKASSNRSAGDTIGLVLLSLIGLSTVAAMVGIAMTQPLAFAIGLGVLMVCGAAVGLWTLVTAFQQSTLEGLLYLFVPFYALFWLLVKCENSSVKMLNLALIVAAFMVGGAAGAMGGVPELSDEGKSTAAP